MSYRSPFYTTLLTASLLVLPFLFPSVVPASPHPVFRHLTVNDGLSQNSVYAIAQDAAGFLWFGTADGLNRYDGSAITVFRKSETDSASLPDNTIRALAGDPEGRLWIGTSRGIAVYDVASGRFDRYDDAFRRAGIATGFMVSSITVDRAGQIWILAFGQVFTLDPVKRTVRDWTAQLDASTDYSFIDQHGDVWLMGGTFMRRFDRAHESFERYIPSEKSDGAITTACIDPQGRLWAASENGEIYTIDTSRHELRPLLRVEPRVEGAYGIVSAEGSLWLGTNGYGLIRVSPATGSVTAFTRKDADVRGVSAPAGDVIRAVACDRSGNIWIGSDGGGVDMLDPRPKKFAALQARPDGHGGLSGNFIKSLFEDDHGYLWAGTVTEGLNRIDLKTESVTSYRHSAADPASLGGSGVFAIGQADGMLLAGTEHGLDLVKPGSKSFLHCSMPSGLPADVRVTAILNDTSGRRILVGTEVGVLQLDLRRRTLARAMMPGENVLSLAIDQRGGLLIGSAVNGLYDAAAGRWFRHTPGDSTSISNNTIQTIYPDSASGGEIVWVGTAYGLNRIDRRSGACRIYTTRDGLPSDWIYGILPDDHGNLWLSTNRGISRFSPQISQFRNYTPEDGLLSFEFNTNAYARGRNGMMYFGGVDGLNYFHPDSVRDNPYAPAVAITGFMLFNKRLGVGAETMSGDTITLAYADNIFSIQFAGLEYTNPARNRYAFRMEGFDEDWNDAGTAREARYTHLSPGTYRFHVKAANSDGIWNDEGAAMTIVIVPPFWRTWWFATIAFLLVGGSVAGTVRYIEMRKLRRQIERLEHERAIERERARISRDLHDEVGSTLTNIALQVELAQRGLGGGEPLDARFRIIARSARDVIGNIGEIVWALKPENDRLDNLAAFVREYGADYLEAANIGFRAEFPDEIPPIAVSAEQRRNIFLVVKEALHNIVKHAGASTVCVRMEIVGTLLRISITDDGKGFDGTLAEGRGNGLANMRKRIGDIGGALAVTSSPGSGTVVRIEYDIHSIA